MSDVLLTEAFRRQLKKLLNVTDSQINTTLKLFNSIIRPELTKNYLSHLKTAIEDLINRHKSIEILKNLTSKGVAVKDRKILETMITSKRFRPFSIIVVPLSRPYKKAFTRLQNSGAIVYYMGELEDKEKRVLIAHELSHIALRMLPTKDPGVASEEIVNLLAIISMYDKNVFYKKDSSSFTFETEAALLTAFENLCVGGVR